MYDPPRIAVALKSAALDQGFVLAGITAAGPAPRLDRLRAWLDAGYAGSMEYLAARLPAYADPNLVLSGARSIIMLAIPYRTLEPPPVPSGTGRVSRYAWGEDYHPVIWKKLDQLGDLLRQWVPGCAVRGVTDSAPLMERDFAQLAGLGWIGKNTLLLNRRWGSWFFLAALLTDLELPADEPFTADHCGTCTACLEVCPTKAFVRPYVLDARRCISYLTIEHREPIPPEQRAALDDWVWGCDLCQEVCPWNNHAPVVDDPQWQPRAGNAPLELTALFGWSDEKFREHFRRSPLWRGRRSGLLRNAAIVLANQQAVAALPVLNAARNDADPVVRDAVCWAIERLTQDKQD